jgi:hypothetical protein
MREHEFDYEALTNTQFQALVSALVAREHPRTQCMALSGRDGGRDTIVQVTADDGKLADVLIFQAKMRQKSVTGVPTTNDLYEWVAAQLRRERRKIRNLIGRGAREYVFVSNVPASGDLDTGLRDRVRDFMASELPLTASAWWREDLDTRLRIYPEIAATHGLLTGEAALRGLCARCGLTESAGSSPKPISVADLDVTVNGVTAFLAAQYKDDRVMRFSQVDLDPILLLDLFVDVPLRQLRLSESRPSRKWEIACYQVAERYDETQRDQQDGESIRYAGRFPIVDHVGTADLLLLSQSDLFLRMLIEGAPGQGKSTVSQYVCQVHRARLLNKTADLDRIHVLHRHSNVRIPFRIELRRYAAWLIEQSNKTRDGLIHYVAELIERASELSFGTNHLVALFCGSPCIVMLDGLDEVADIDTRNVVIDNITKLSENLNAWDADSLLIVTSRPTTLIAGNALPITEFEHFNLSNLSRSHIFEYADAWVAVKKLSAEKNEEIKEVLTLSLESKHVADLARNPMQLAILLYLIHTRGNSLPEKRTALYHSYIETFQMRESDKSLPVSKYGNLLLDLHGYLAWLLHSRAELKTSGGAQGDIATTELIQIVASYLEFEGYDPALAGQIFVGVQRFFVLVARVEGRFEFEVQPLREFFAARHLYTTSPQGPSAEEPAGTRPDRLEALLRNPYWLNVLRFFVGHYQKGELPDLARRLIDLTLSPDWGGTSRPYDIIYRVMQDYSMYQSRRDTREVAAALGIGIGARLISRGFESSYRSSLRVDKFTEDTGQAEIIRVTRELLEKRQTDEVTQELAATLAVNDPAPAEWWLRQWKSSSSDNRRRVILARIGSQCGAFEVLSLEDAADVFLPTSPLGHELWIRCLEAGRHDVAQLDVSRLSCVINELSNGSLVRARSSHKRNWLSDLLWLLRTTNLRRLDRKEQFQDESVNEVPSVWAVENNSQVDLSELQALSASLAEPISTTQERHDRWVRNVEVINRVLGQGWTSWRAAFAPILQGEIAEQGTCVDLLDSSKSQIDRLGSALQSRSDSDYWIGATSSNELHDPHAHGNRMAISAATFAWASSEVLNAVLPHMATWWHVMTPRDCGELRDFLLDIQYTRTVKTVEVVGKLAQFDSLDQLPPNLTVFISPRLRSADRKALLSHLTELTRSQEDEFLDGEIVAGLTGVVIRQPDNQLIAEVVKRHAQARYGGHMLRSPQERRAVGRRFMEKFPATIAAAVLAQPLIYPWDLVEFCDRVLTARVVKSVVPMRLTANEAGWFRYDADSKRSDKSAHEAI